MSYKKHTNANDWGGSKISAPPKIKPLPAGKPLAPYTGPLPLPPGKFRNIPGQAAMDFSRDEWDALTDPGGEEAAG